MKRIFKAFLMITCFCLMASMTVVGAGAAAPIVGDVNGDGEVNLKDAVLLFRYASDWNVELVSPCYHKGTVVIDHAVEQTCTVDGKTEGVHCTACGEVLMEQIVSAAPGHTEGDWIIDKEALGSEDGLKHTECTVCGTKIKEEIISGVVPEGLAYALNSDGTAYTVTGIGTCTDTDVVIPAVYNGKPVTSISDSAFSGCTSITSVSIPESVTSIGSNAFYACFSIKDINIPNNVTTIGESAFSGCHSITSINIPDGVTSIEFGTFSDCPSLENINIPSGVISIGDIAFLGCESLISISIPKSVVSIGESAFQYCSNFNAIMFESTIAQWEAVIKCDAWADDTPVKYVTCSDGNYCLIHTEGEWETVKAATKTEDGSRQQKCTACGKVIKTEIIYATGSAGLRYILNSDNESYFVDGIGTCKDTIIIIPETYNSKPVVGIGDDAFSGQSHITDVIIGNSVTSIGNNAFQDCSSFSNIIIPNSVASIGDRAFSNCSNLISITIPNSVTMIGDYIFSNCSNLIYNEYNNGYYLGNENNPYLIFCKANSTSIAACEINSNTRFIYSSAFYNCENLESIILPNGVTDIGDWAFNNCTSLASINIPDGATTIGNCAFQNCSSLTSIILPDSVTSIEFRAFENCSNLKNVIFSENLKRIEQETFQKCYRLTSITLPSSITSIGDEAFDSCSNLATFKFNGTTAQWNSITKGTKWKNATAFITVQCINGNVIIK